MNYIDTNVILCFLNEDDANHDKAVRLWELKESKVASEITLLEIRSVLSRKANLKEAEIEAYIEYLPEIGVRVAEIDLNGVFNRSMEIAYKTRMKTLDVLHISACLEINASNFVTLDYEFVEKSKFMTELGLTIVSA